MRIAIMGAVIKPMVILVRPTTGSGTWKESGCMTKIVERKNNIRVAMAKPLISDMTSDSGKKAQDQGSYTFAAA
jgi:hypothetical protein